MLLDLGMTSTAIALSLLSGMSAYLQGCKDDRIKRGWLFLFAEVSVSCVVGLAVMYFGTWREFHEALICGAILVSAYRASDSIEKIKAKLFQRYPIKNK